MPVTDADREAANALRAILADICGYWHRPDDDGPLCQALARHRAETEARLAEKLLPIQAKSLVVTIPDETTRPPWLAAEPRRPALPRVVAPIRKRLAD